MRTGIATFGLDSGQCPPWLFEKMRRLAKVLTEAIVYEFGPQEFLRRMADPFFFQSFGTILAFDWDASGLTTTTTAALKEALRGTERHLGIFVAGGKGKTSLKTPGDITRYADWYGFDPAPLVHASKMSAKVDNTAVQDGFTLYHHTFLFVKGGPWAVVQQGMDTGKGRARRYHWLSEGVRDFVEEPHAGIRDSAKPKPDTRNPKPVLNLVAKESRKTKEVSAGLVRDNLKTLLSDLKVLDMVGMPFDRRRMEKTLRVAHEKAPGNFEKLLGIEGVGPKTVRALSLISEIVYGAKPSYKDPARYAFAHGGKDGIPYFVDRKTYDKSIEVLEKAVRKAKMGHPERLRALKKIARYQSL